jgi:hypothetical protein
MQHRSIGAGIAALLAATAAAAGGGEVSLHAQAAAAAPAAFSTLHGLNLNPAQKAAAGYTRMDNTLARIAQQAATLPKPQLLGRLQASVAGPRFNLREPLAVPDVLADIQLSGDGAALEQQLRRLGAQHLSRFSNLISAFIPADRLKDAAALDGVRFMRAPRARARTGSITTQGDFVQHSDLVRASTAVPGLTGAGIAVGVLSDSFACTSAVKSYQDDIASGDLPADVQILSEYNATLAGVPSPGSSCDGATDEGRAMAQIVWDVAPGTRLKFYTAFNGEADFANGILALAGAGAKVITDDVGYLDEPVFQDGILAQAVDQVTALGVAYFSSAGNSARQSYEADYKDSGTVGASGADNAGEKLMAFTSTDGKTTQNWLPFSVPAGFSEQSVQILEWDQPYVTGAPDSHGASSALDICVTDATGKVISGGCSGANPVGGDPVSLTGLVTDGSTTAYGLQVGVVGGSAVPHHIKIIFQDDGSGTQAAAAFATYSPTIQGHPGAAGAAAVGASYFRANPVCLPALYPAYTLEDYSSAGGDPILFDLNGTRLASPLTRQKPDFVAPDGGNTTFFAEQIGARDATVPQCRNAAGSWNFFGTSAAAPHAAGVAALLMQAMPAATPDRIRKVLGDTAIVGMALADGSVPGVVNFGTGHGFIQADQALAAIVPRVLSLSGRTLAFGDQRVGTTSTRQAVTLSNGGGFPTTINSIAGSGDFSLGNDCPMAPATLAPHASCTVQVAAAPTVTGARSGSVIISSDAASSPDSIALTANGVQSKALLAPKSVDFGEVTQGASTRSSPFTKGTQQVSLVNVGTAPLNIGGISSGDPSFIQANNCPPALAAGASCTIRVDFSPAAAKPYSSQLSLASDGAADGDSQVALSGTGTPASSGGAFGLCLLLPGFGAAALRRRKRG